MVKNSSFTTTIHQPPLHHLLGRGLQLPSMAISSSSNEGTPPVDPSIAKRLDFLWEQAIAHLEPNRNLSRLLTRQLIRTSALTLTALNPVVDELICTGCGSILIPGKTARIRLHHRTRKGAYIKRKKQRRVGGGLLKNEVNLTCLSCSTLKRLDGARAAAPAVKRRPLVRDHKTRASSSSVPAATGARQKETREEAARQEKVEEDFIPLSLGSCNRSGKKVFRAQKEPSPPRLLLDRKKGLRKRKRPPQSEEGKKESRSLEQLKEFISSFKVKK